MKYTLTPGTLRCYGTSRTELLPLLRFTPECPLIDLQRGSGLARALAGRYARGLIAFHLLPSSARKFRILFDAGFGAHRKIIRGHSFFEFSRNGVTFTLSKAMSIARKEATCKLS